ncbi:MAG: right-handed parallel beta-helix repeat-containing protein, partial [Alphaproteobacteria bacterium]|nr:right-handed parallel beta-helix repeat-containing protein [Alphaproteobacteria bacterium]
MLLLLALAHADDVPVSTVGQLAGAISGASDGDAIVFDAGTYEVSAKIDVNKDLTFRPASGASVTIESDGQHIFEVKGGAAVTIEDLTLDGGGVTHVLKVQNGSLLLTDVTVQNTDNANGGAVVVDQTGTLTIDGGSFSASTATFGGFIHARGPVTATGTLFTGGSALDSGGALYGEGSGTFALTGCTFTNNSAASGGGALAVFVGSSATITDCTFAGGSADEGGQVASYGDITVTGSTFSGGSATDGGALHVQGPGGLSVARSTVSGANASGLGGAVYCDGASFCRVLDSTLRDGSADRGGAIYAVGTTLTLNRDLFCDNEAARGGALAVDGSNDAASRVAVNGFIRNDGSDRGGAISMEANPTRELITEANAFVANTSGSGSAAHVPLQVVFPPPPGLTFDHSAFVDHANPTLFDISSVHAFDNLFSSSPLPLLMPDIGSTFADASLPTVDCSWDALVPTTTTSLMFPDPTDPARVGPLLARPDGHPDLDDDGYVGLVDCDDTTDTVYPTADEVPANNVDDDCDGQIDE